MRYKLLWQTLAAGREDCGSDERQGRFSGFCEDMRTDIRKQANISVLFL